MTTPTLLRTIILSGWILGGFIALVVILSIVVLSFLNKPIPNVLDHFGGVIIGFFFGQFASFIKDALLPQPKDTSPSGVEGSHQARTNVP
jgi:uncharacterized membrane protein AbrB (regulator of aidB expression)